MVMKANKERQPPLLLISHGEQKEKQTFYDVMENRFRTTTIPVLCNKQVLASIYGWLVLVDTDTDECCVWNPVSMDVIQLPELEMACTYNRCVLTKPPTEPDCHILLTCASQLQQAYCRIGDDEFVTQYIEPDDDAQALTAIGSFQGEIYGIAGSHFQFATIHFVGKTLALRPIWKEGQPWRGPEASRPWANWDQDYLIESPSDGELLLVRRLLASCYINDYCDFRVFRIDTHRMEWIELEDIGQRTIFISHIGEGFCCPSIGTKPNCIYYMREVRECRNLYIHDLDDRSTTVLLPCPAVRRFQSVAFWLEHEALHKLISLS